MKRTLSHPFAALGLALLASACQSTAASPELRTARDVYAKAEDSRATEVAAADLRDAEQALQSAEAAHNDAPRSRAERSYAYLAVRKAQLAMAKADADTARAEQLHAAQAQGARPYAELLREARSELAERESDLAERERALSAAETAREEAAEQSDGAEALEVSGVFFETESADLSREAQSQLDALADNLRAHEDQILVVRGYADARGPSGYNQVLSRERAQAVRQYLVSKGVPAERLRIEALGERLPLARNDTPAGRANNRRVEIVTAPAGGAPTDDTAASAQHRQERRGAEPERQNVSGRDKPGDPREP